MIVYLESSAAVKLLRLESETIALRQYCDRVVESGDVLLTAALTETELRRAAQRWNRPQESVTAILDRLDVADMERAVFTAAGVLSGPHLRSLDALHVAAALYLNAEVLVSYDRRQIEAAAANGIRTVSPA